jgi:translocation and assembly module TamB
MAMEPDPSAAPSTMPEPVAREFRWRRRIAWLIGTLVLLLVLLLVAAGGGLWWSVRSNTGTAWLFTHLPGLKITNGQGTLWGDYEAERLEFALPGGGRVVLTRVGWHGLHLERAAWTAYRTRVAMSELHAERVDLLLPGDSKAEPRKLPATLRFPVALDVGTLRIGEFHTAALGEQPLRDLQAQVHFESDRGALHRIDGLTLAWDKLKASGAARIGTQSPFTLDVQAALTQDAAAGAVPAWRADVALSGALTRPAVRATVRAQPDASHREQALDLRATLRPFDTWPLGDLQASTRALDLSAFHRALPVTSISGEANAQTTGVNQPATVTASLANAESGRWNEGRLPVRRIDLALRARPDDPRTLDIQKVDAELGNTRASGGRIEGHGRWTPQQWSLEATLHALQPSQLDARAAAMVLSGPVSASGRGFGGPLDQAVIDLKAELAGQFAGQGPARSAQLTLDASLVPTLRHVDLRHARAVAGGARADLSGSASHAGPDAPWQLKGQMALVDFDPLPWWPGREGSAWRKGPNRLNAKADFDLVVPGAAAGASAIERLTALRGRADAAITNSVLAGVPLAGSAALRNTDGGNASAALKLDAGGNSVTADGRLARRADDDQWDLRLSAPALNQLAPLWRMGPAPQGESALTGTLTASAHVAGRWPRIATQGQVDASALHIGRTSVEKAQARWQLDTHTDAAVDVQAQLVQLAFSQTLFKGLPPIDAAQLQLKGTMSAHRLELHADTKALPPAWTDTLQVRPVAASGAASAVVASGPSPSAHTTAVLIAQGGALQAPVARGAAPHWNGWRGSLQQLELRSSDPRLAPWLRVRDVAIETQWADGPLRVAVQPGRAEILGAALRWNRIAWQAAAGNRPAQIDAQAELEPVPVAPMLARVQPTFGWGGDLAVVGHLNIHSAPSFVADIVLERQGGDLSVTDESGKTQALGLTDLRVGLDAHGGVWSFTQGLAGKTLGVAAGAVVARTSPQATWPAPNTPIQGVLEVQVANLGTWGPWLPAGWRLTGALRTSAGIGGTFGAPEYTGAMTGSGIGVRNFLLGVNVTDGDIAVALQGATARIDRFTAKAGNGTVKLEGNATLGQAPKAFLKLAADKFQLLGRVDRRVVTSGQAQLQLDRETLALDGQFAIDEGLIDFSRSDAPKLSDDVQIVRSKQAEAEEPAPTGAAAPGHTVKLDVQVNLGNQLRLRGRGLDTALRGELRITAPGNHLAINGTVRAEDGTYAAYGQKLAIERGLITFNGPAENPRLDIEATRPNLDVRVGVLVSGTALNPRVRLFSEPEMAEIDKLSWLVLGRASEGLGRTDTALLQRAALALLAGEGEGVGDQFTKAIGLDEVSLRQTEGEVKETVISLGKQLSRRWYVGYERSLNATTGTWQLIYRIAQRFTLRAQTGADSSLDVIWTWRWQ